MLFDPKHEMSLERLARETRLAPSPTRDLFSKITKGSCNRLQAQRAAGRAEQYDHLIEAGAWTDAAISLIGLELPGWNIRRLVYDDGEWICSLSRQPNLPLELDDTADASHEVLPLAILGALVEALRRNAADNKSAASVPQVKAETAIPAYCDNFA